MYQFFLVNLHALPKGLVKCSVIYISFVMHSGLHGPPGDPGVANIINIIKGQTGPPGNRGPNGQGGLPGNKALSQIIIIIINNSFYIGYS